MLSLIYLVLHELKITVIIFEDKFRKKFWNLFEFVLLTFDHNVTPTCTKFENL